MELLNNYKIKKINIREIGIVNDLIYICIFLFHISIKCI
jgi:hypothetical protein